MSKNGKRIKELDKKVEPEKIYSIEKAVQIVKENATAKFDETIEVSLNLGVDPKQSDQNVRGVVALPHGSGKTMRVAVFAKGDQAKVAQDSGADEVGAEDLAEKMQSGNINFDRVISTPDLMGIVGKLGKVLGPRGLMPNPKLGTVTPDIKKAIANAKAGEVQFRSEKAGLVHAGIGKASFSEKEISENLKAFVGAVIKSKPAATKGSFVKKISLSSTMGLGIKVNVSEAVAS